MVDLARDRSIWAKIESIEQLESSGERQKLTGIWFAALMRSYQRNGQVSEVAYVSRPLQANYDFANFKFALDVIAGERPTVEYADWSQTEVRMIPSHLSDIEPVQAVYRLLAGEDCADDAQPVR